ncbi:MAG: hypothetical protein KDK39_05645 [Leptospiraceae bacterium]|nr:hypothetical protein [Leptospiraceae bacterium]
MISYCRITGPLLLLVFGVLWLMLEIRLEAIETERRLLANSRSYTFARIARTQKLNKFAPIIEPRYYFSLEGRLNQSSFNRYERVDARLYHLYSVGSNIEVITAHSPDGRLLVHIRNNPVTWAEDLTWLIAISRFLHLLGLGLTSAGYLVLPLLARSTHWQWLYGSTEDS